MVDVLIWIARSAIKRSLYGRIIGCRRRLRRFSAFSDAKQSYDCWTFVKNSGIIFYLSISGSLIWQMSISISYINKCLFQEWTNVHCKTLKYRNWTRCHYFQIITSVIWLFLRWKKTSKRLQRCIQPIIHFYMPVTVAHCAIHVITSGVLTDRLDLYGTHLKSRWGDNLRDLKGRCMLPEQVLMVSHWLYCVRVAVGLLAKTVIWLDSDN